jgi:hypothetical protein
MAVLLSFIKGADRMILFTSQRKYPARDRGASSKIIENRCLADQIRVAASPCKNRMSS